MAEDGPETELRDERDRLLHARPSRREVLGAFGTTALMAAGAAAVAGFRRVGAVYVPERPTGQRQVRDFRTLGAPARLALAKSSTDARELVRRAVTALGGMSRFVSRGDIVAIKPNIGWDRTPAHGANTNPLVVAELVRQCLDAGAHRVVVTDASCNEARRSFQRSGIWRAAHDAGAVVVLPAEHRFRSMRLRGELLDEWPVYTPLIEADRVINAPVAKHHNLSFYTGAMKNWYGVLGGRRNRLHQNIHRSIADLATFMRPTLTVLDMTRVLFRNGPQGGNIADARDVHQVLAGTDEVAIDAYGAALVGAPIERVHYLQLGVERGLGQLELADLVTV